MHKLKYKHLSLIVDFAGGLIPILIIVQESTRPYSYMSLVDVLLYSLPFIIYLILSLILVKLCFDEKTKFKASTFGSVIFTNYIGLYPFAIAEYFSFDNLKIILSVTPFELIIFLLYILIPIIVITEFFKKILRKRADLEWIFIVFYMSALLAVPFFPGGYSGVHSAAWGYLLILAFGYPLLMVYFSTLYAIKVAVGKILRIKI